jgi:thiol-disulfide isomerase/thioredoxin
MAEKGRERRFRPWLLLVLLVAVAGTVWVLVPVPFARGVVLGFVSGPLVMFLAVSLLARRFRSRISDRLEPPPLQVAQWDYDLVARELNGEEIRFEEFSGEVLVLNFWATWCAPCVAEMPSLKRLQDAVAEDGVRLACLTREDPAKVRNFAEKRDLRVPIYVMDGDLPEIFKSRGIPATFVLDKKGTVALRHFGAAAWDHEDVVNFIRGLATAPEL